MLFLTNLTLREHLLFLPNTNITSQPVESDLDLISHQPP